MLIPNVKLDASLLPCLGKLDYIIDEYSFSFDYQNAELTKHQAWLCFGPIEVAFSCITGQLLGPSGYVGPRIWSDSGLSPVGQPYSSALVLEGFEQCEVGIGYAAEGNGLEKVHFNQKSGWAHVGNRSAKSGILVEFATNCCAEIHGEKIVALWLHPENWRNLA